MPHPFCAERRAQRGSTTEEGRDGQTGTVRHLRSMRRQGQAPLPSAHRSCTVQTGGQDAVETTPPSARALPTVQPARSPRPHLMPTTPPQGTPSKGHQDPHMNNSPRAIAARINGRKGGNPNAGDNKKTYPLEEVLDAFTERAIKGGAMPRTTYNLKSMTKDDQNMISRVVGVSAE